MNSPSRSPDRWEKQGETVLATTRIFDLRSIRYRHPRRASERDFFVLHSPDWVNVLAVTPDHQLVLVKQFRYGIDDFSLEIPGGVLDVGESPLAAGLRELREETGYAGTHASLVGRVHPNPAIMNNHCHLVAVENVVSSGQTDWDPDEEIEVITAPVDQVYAWANEGRITHSLVLNALLLFRPRWEAIKRR
jgi:ADP-ribose pyrophosphatase